MLRLSDYEEAELMRELRRMRDMLQMCNETVHSGVDAEIKANYVDWKSRWGKSPYFRDEGVLSLRRGSYARKSGSGQAAINMGLEYIEKLLLIIKKNREVHRDDKEDEFDD